MADQPTTVRYRVLAWLTLAAALSYLCRSALSVAESSVRSDLGLTVIQSGWCMSAFFWTYAIFQIPCGWFSERVGTRIALTIFAVGWSVATIGIGVAPGFWMLIVAQLIMGAAQAGIFPAACNSIGHWMPLAQRSFGCGVLTAGMQIGAIAASGLTGMLVTGVVITDGLIINLGWRWVFALFALPGFLWAVGFISWFRDQPEKSSAVNEKELALIRADRASIEVHPINEQQQSVDHEPFALLRIARSPVMWWLCGQQICRASGYMFFASWFPTFLQETRGVSVAQSGYLQGLVFAGTLAGCIFGGVLTDWIWKRTGGSRFSRSAVGAVALGACSVLILAAWFVKSPELAVALLTLGSFFAALAGPAAFTAVIDIGGPRVPQVFGLMNMVGNLAAAACPIIVGKLFEVSANWNLVLLLFAGVYFAGAVCWVFVNPRSHDIGTPSQGATQTSAGNQNE